MNSILNNYINNKKEKIKKIQNAKKVAEICIAKCYI